MRSLSSQFRVYLFLFSLVFLFPNSHSVYAQRRRPPSGGRIAIVVDERLAALRATPDLAGDLVRRIGRGKAVSIRGERRGRDGVAFYRVSVTTRTGGWLQKEAVISAQRFGDDARLLRLIRGSSDFDLISRARIFLGAFPRSSLRPAVLRLLAETAEKAAGKLSRDASRRLSDEEMHVNDAPMFTYFLNYSGLDRYNRHGIRFRFDPSRKSFRYDGAAWREILRRYPRSAEAVEARKRLDGLSKLSVPGDVLNSLPDLEGFP